MSELYIHKVTTPGTSAIIMPDGFESTVEIHAWGAGGGSGYYGGTGGSGGYARTTLTMDPGQMVQFGIGTAGQNAAPHSGGAGGQGMDPRFNGGNGGDSYDNDMGAGGGGGGATVVTLNGSVVLAAAGGGGGGGSGEEWSGYGYPGYPGGVYPSVASTVYYRVTHPAWVGFLNTYGIWGGSGTMSMSVNFPVTGTYTFNLSVDNYGSFLVDNNAIISQPRSEFNYRNIQSQTATITAGVHTVTVAGYNLGGPAGIAGQILNPDASELWNTTSLLYTSGLNSFPNGLNGGVGSAGGGGGGGGYLGGSGGSGAPDEAYPYGASGGQGGLNYGFYTLAGSGVIAGGKSTAYAPAVAYGNAGYNGYLVMVFKRKVNSFVKISGAWKSITNAWIKKNGAWKEMSNAFIKQNGKWLPVISTDTITLATKQAITYTSITPQTFVVPAGVTSLIVDVIGAGGGHGGYDRLSGYPGLPGQKVIGLLLVNPGDTITIYVGAAGATGASGGGAPGGAGGASSLGYSGGVGGNSGPKPWSGAGGGGGAATVIKVNGVVTVVAGGGGGGGGGGNYSYGAGPNGSASSGVIYGGSGANHPRDGAGGGGGGGGQYGGGGGLLQSTGDYGAYSGMPGRSLLPTGFIEVSANNGTGNGSVVIGYYV